jgi:predicted ATPase
VAHATPDEREEIIFDIVNQFNRGIELITSENERFQVAELNLGAGKRAKASTAHASALRYFIAGQLLLTTEAGSAATISSSSWNRIGPSASF